MCFTHSLLISGALLRGCPSASHNICFFLGGRSNYFNNLKNGEWIRKDGLKMDLRGQKECSGRIGLLFANTQGERKDAYK